MHDYLLHINNVPLLHEDLKTLFSLLSHNLRFEILHHIYKKVIDTIPFLHECSRVEIDFMVSVMKTVVFLPQDFVITQGHNATSMYFIQQGKCYVY